LFIGGLPVVKPRVKKTGPKTKRREENSCVGAPDVSSGKGDLKKVTGSAQARQNSGWEDLKTTSSIEPKSGLARTLKDDCAPGRGSRMGEGKWGGFARKGKRNTY